MKILKRVDFSGKDKHIKVIRLPDKDLEIADELECFATGWGRTEADGK